MENNIRPNKAELEFLTLSYNKFYSIFTEILDDSFWKKNKRYRFNLIKSGFAIYSELLNYEPIKWEIEKIKSNRPPMEAEIGNDLFKVIRNIIGHFPYFDTWDDIYFSKSIINWNRPGQTIDKFFTNFEHHEPVKYRFWEENMKRMTYISINFPNDYSNNNIIFLKTILSEKDGIRFSFIMMRNILNTQIQ